MAFRTNGYDFLYNIDISNHNVYCILKTWLNCAIFSHNPSPDFQIIFHADEDFSSVTNKYGRITSPFLLAHSNVPILVLTLRIPVLISYMWLAHLPWMEATGSSETLVMFHQIKAPPTDILSLVCSHTSSVPH